MGRDFGLEVPVVSTELMYYIRSGVYVNLSALKFMEENLPWQYALSLGYATDLSEKTDVNISCSQFLVAGESAIAGIQNLAFLKGSFGMQLMFKIAVYLLVDLKVINTGEGTKVEYAFPIQ